jgi:hypothetical protein
MQRVTGEKRLLQQKDAVSLLTKQGGKHRSCHVYADDDDIVIHYTF